MAKNELLSKLQRLLPNVSFVQGKAFFWSPRETTITYPPSNEEPVWTWSLLHEAAHADLGHTSYSSDIELLLLEAAAWKHAKEFAGEFNSSIDEEHVQDCLDTYRDWLHRRATCPSCSVVSLQDSPSSYKCINCAASWRVSASRFCRPYRLTKTNVKEKSPASKSKQATFR